MTHTRLHEGSGPNGDSPLSNFLLHDPRSTAAERWEEMKRYVGFGPPDEAALSSLQTAAERGLPRLLDDFYGTIARHPDAARVFTEAGGDPERLRRTLSDWVLTCTRGPYDGAYVERRRAIGTAHVRHQLPQRYMLLAMNLVRRWFIDRCVEVHAASSPALIVAIRAVDRLLDIELALMLDTYRNDLLARLQRQERLATIGELAAGIHHELKNPLAAVDASLFALSDRRSVRSDPRAREHLERAQANVLRASHIITDMLTFARLRTPSLAPTPVDDLVGRAVGRVTIPPAIKLVEDLDPALPALLVDAAQIEQVLINVLTNAFDACGAGGVVRIVSRLGADGVLLSVEDNGSGIEPDHVGQVFDPLYSTKPEGIGLGLSLSRNLMQANGGVIRLTSKPAEGTTVTLVLPTR